jgi:RimJ/RimL family protein N-acetyltransferase
VSGAQVTIRPLKAGDIPGVVEIFCEQFPNLSWTQLGRNFIHTFITWHFKYHPDLALVAEQDNRLIGFIVGSTGGHREYYRQVLRYAFPEFLTGSLLHPWLVLRPSFWTLWLEWFRGLRSPRTDPKEIAVSKSGEKKANLSFVAVTAAAQGGGVGTNLKRAFEQAAFQAGIEVLSSYTEINNLAARRLNEKLGWKQVREDTQRKMVYFSKRLDKNL